MKGDLSVALNSNSFFIKNSERDCGSISISPVFWNDKDEYFGGFEMTAEAAELLKHRDKMCSKNFMPVVEVEIVGKIYGENRDPGYYQRVFEIRVKEIKQVSPVKSYELDLPDWFKTANCKVAPNLCYCSVN